MNDGPLLVPTIPGFVIERELGRGGMGVVYAAHRARLPELTVAIKVLSGGPRKKEGAERGAKRFLEEARTLASLRHPHIVELMDYGVLDDQTPYLVMELSDGPSLKEYVAGRPLLPLAEALSYVRDVAGALRYLHARGIIHRDVKPGNILLSHSAQGPFPYRPLLADFGISLRTEALPGGDNSSDEPCYLLGTKGYAAPEQWSQGGLVDGAADVYALGIVLFELLSGQPPYDNGGETAQGEGPGVPAHFHRAPRPLRPDLPAGIEPLVQAMLVQEPSQRARADWVFHRLEQILFWLTAPSQAPETRSETTQTDTGSLTQRDWAAAAAPAGSPGPAARMARARWLLLVALVGVLVLNTRFRPRPVISPPLPGQKSIAATVVSPNESYALPGMVRLPAGRFVMGLLPAEQPRERELCPDTALACDRLMLRRSAARPIELPSFFIQRYEVTQQELAEFLNRSHLLLRQQGTEVESADGTRLAELSPSLANGVWFDARTREFRVATGYEARPAVQITWHGAVAYCMSLGYRLPTEAEWEYAARSASNRRALFPWGDTLPRCGDAVLDRYRDPRSPQRSAARCLGLGEGPTAVGSALTDRTPQGVSDLAGNVEEWVADRFTVPFEEGAAKSEARGATGRGSEDRSVLRVVRGASFAESPYNGTVSNRTRWPADRSATTIGFRCATEAESF